MINETDRYEMSSITYLRILAIAFTLALPMTCAAPAVARTASNPVNPQIDIVYVIAFEPLRGEADGELRRASALKGPAARAAVHASLFF
jgi:hypothetical protein